MKSCINPTKDEKEITPLMLIIIFILLGFSILMYEMGKTDGKTDADAACAASMKTNIVCSYNGCSKTGPVTP